MKNARQCHPKMLTWHLTIAVIIGVVIVLTVIVLVIITRCTSVVIIVVSWCAAVLVAFIGIIFTRIIFS